MRRFGATVSAWFLAARAFMFTVCYRVRQGGRRYCLLFLVLAGFLGVSGSGLRWCMVSPPVL
eukprot:3184272-Pyramimonas_sp.AAC.1